MIPTNYLRITLRRLEAPYTQPRQEAKIFNFIQPRDLSNRAIRYSCIHTYFCTRIVYERAFLMNLRNSPISRTPPRNIPAIPADLLKGTLVVPTIPSPPIKDIPVIDETPEQFEMDM
ncbi:eukaryotic translation initiation factor 4E-binding protein 3 isoform X1 [Neodiprion pinetum]|uniref:Eukaryotic translation initiation factor 4E-binding protein 3 isoform X1 n=1 Tax=Neodiprion lecontei TaxID=441921 RepID=A0ABM3FRA3_NEOLC|nr:eukaryotic translation initiation factor 4E-binding protein 3 isoform X1 [Neodiprion fabricii]XP_046473515.1 eukaryotic translation initiation factor 4E-binding protein 3 isoform X1 [Neodiprion pinetum]XP_046590559.1 eukaryotic translation initiation factor 4E-binding protein 3 isoform X1 [Neodiprion lecontei]